jgi:hypothetical protein
MTQELTTGDRWMLMPGRLKAVVIFLAIQAVITLIVTWPVIGLLAAGFQAACLVFTLRPKDWARVAIIVIQVLNILSGLFYLFNGVVVALLGLALAGAVVYVLTTDEVRRWYLHGAHAS